MPETNETNDGAKVVAEAPQSSFFESVWTEIGRIPQAVAGFVDELPEIAGDFFETLMAEDSPYEDNLAAEGEKAEAKQSGVQVESESAQSGESLKSGLLDPSDTAKRSLERTNDGKTTIENFGSVIEHPGEPHLVESEKFAKFKEVTQGGLKFYVEPGTGDVYTSEPKTQSATGSKVSLTRHPNLVATTVDELDKGEVSSHANPAEAEKGPAVSIDFGKTQVESVRSVGNAGLVEKARASVHALNVEPIEASRSIEAGEVAGTSRRSGQKSLGEGVAPLDGLESRGLEEKFHEPHDPIFEIGGVVALGFAAWWGADWFFSSKEDQSKASKPSESAVPVTGVDP